MIIIALAGLNAIDAAEMVIWMTNANVKLLLVSAFVKFRPRANVKCAMAMEDGSHNHQRNE